MNLSIYSVSHRVAGKGWANIILGMGSDATKIGRMIVHKSQAGMQISGGNQFLIRYAHVKILVSSAELPTIAEPRKVRS